MNSRLIALAAAGAFGFVFVSPGPARAAEKKSAAGAELELALHGGKGELEIRFKDRPLLVYAFASNQFKPYVRELRTLGGDNVLRDAPADHLHHHGLMYAIRVNGVNFWEETGQAGHERSVKLLTRRRGKSPAGLPQTTFSQLIHWVADKDKARLDTESCALLVERRTLTLTVNENAGEVALDWRGEFEAGAGALKVTLTGSDYNGLGLRLPETFDHAARHQNSEDTPYSATQNRDVIAARWSAVSHSMNGREATVVLLADPSRTAGTTRFFSMLNPFAYLSITQGLDKAPLEYKAGDKFGIAYLVLVYSGVKSKAFLQQRYQQWYEQNLHRH
ncbi:MAG: PmoA family protein [Verrucomicrobia bacterium]|nr:PmoA family protein [Verrucomicrobiota bacterium]